MSDTDPVLVEYLRGGRVESRHRGRLVVVGAGAAPSGVSKSLGDPARPLFARSAVKPFQAAAVVASGAAERFRLDDADLAMIASSHSSEPAQVARVADLLARGGFTMADLQCGTHPPFSRRVERELAREGCEPSPLHHNCSGKHAGMLLAARALGADPTRYLDAGHPVQTLARRAVAEVCGCANGFPEIAVDGCSAPTFLLPLQDLARGFRALGRSEHAPEAWREPLDRVRGAMLARPELVAGEGRIDTDLMRAGAGRCVSKIGAEGVVGIGLPGRDLGLALKIEDGAGRAADALAVAALEVLGLLDGWPQEARSRLARYRPDRLVNHAGRPVGAVRTHVGLLAG